MLSSAEEKLVHALRRRKERERRGLFLAEGVRIAEELLDAGIRPDLVIVSPGLLETERGRALRADERLGAVREVPDTLLSRIAPTDTPQGILLVARVPTAPDALLEREGSSLILVLDGVQDPGNLGTLIRAADAFDAAAIVCLPGTVDAWNPKTVRAAAGSVFRVPILSMADDAAARLHAAGWRILVADANGRPVEARDAGGRTALVVGNEGAGVGAGWVDAADAVVAVPTPGPVESLNVAVATGILLYALQPERERNG